MTDIHDFTRTPDDLELLGFFESEAIESIPEDGYWCYEFTDSHGNGLRVSCNVLEKSVQTVVLFGGHEIQTVVHEGAEELVIRENRLYGRFDLGADSRLTIQLKPSLSVQWSSLRKS
jgi:hypothetical protein